jgi:hypothetical protein
MTTFSIHHGPVKGDLIKLARGTAVSKAYAPGIGFIAEACTHHPLADDIGRVKIPAGCGNTPAGPSRSRSGPVGLSGRPFPLCAGHHCGACVVNRKAMLPDVPG